MEDDSKIEVVETGTLFKKRRCSKKIFFLIIILVLFLIYLISCLKIIGPISGIIRDAKTGEPIKNVKIIHAIGRRTGFGDYFYENIEYSSDENGKFFIPKKIRFFLHPFTPFVGDNILVNINSVGSGPFEWVNYIGFDPLSFYSGYVYDKGYHPYAHDYCTDKLPYACYVYPEGNSSSMFREGTMYNSYSSERILDIKLIPEIGTIEECNLIKDDKYRSNCISLTSYEIAVKDENAKICENIFLEIFKKHCISDVHLKIEKY